MSEALEYSSQEAGGLLDIFHIPPNVQELINKVESLDANTQIAYENGDTEEAENLDAQLASAQEQLETAMDELGFEGESRTGGEEEKEASFGSDELMRQFSSIYKHYINQIPFQGNLLTEDELVEFLRVWARDYGWALGGFKEGTTNEQLLDAAKDSYDTLKRLTRK